VSSVVRERTNKQLFQWLRTFLRSDLVDSTHFYLFYFGSLQETEVPITYMEEMSEHNQ